MSVPLDRLGDYLQELELSQKVRSDDFRNQMLKQGLEEIVDTLLGAIAKKDPRFKCTRHGSGSYYDGVKVGEPDEFDFIAELDALSQEGMVFMVPTSDPGFLQIEVPSMEVKRKWKDCLVLPHHLQSASAAAMYHSLPGEADTHTIDITDGDLHQTCILGPFKVQKLFKFYVDECMKSIELPENWLHGGYQKPHYSGCRRHGPATMLQFIFKSRDEEIKINIDITLGIAVCLPTAPEKLNMYVLDKLKRNGFVYNKVQDMFVNGPNLHVIPLYSNVLIKTRKYQNKYAWRISCSLVETAILDLFPDEGPKRCLRMLKAIRDKFLCEGKRKTRRSRKKNRKRKRQRGNSSKRDGSASSNCSLQGMAPHVFTKRMRETKEQWENIREKYLQFNVNPWKTKPEDVVGHTSPILDPVMESMEATPIPDDDPSDATELEERSKEEAFREFRKTRMNYQRKDIKEMVAEPGSGEYYGPKTFMSSIEIKTYVLSLIGKHNGDDFWSLDNIVKHVNDFLRSYHTILLERKMMKSFFFDSMLCAPISEEQRLKALEKFNSLFDEINKVMEGNVGLECVSQLR